ncbi:MAG TPA: HAD-IC family P-type ATPase, partial [Solirubrobacteraceae bacterium]|nr:HAD-IC family P-type ATPase [Solirubrobacteraceae bacterium]
MTVAEQGLTETEAAARLAAAPRRASAASSRSLRSIVLANTFTVFNAILTVAGAFTLAFGDWRDALFLGILIANTSIGIAQELRAKRALDRLAALVAPTAVVVRDGSARTIGVEDVVPGDLVRLEAGDGIVGDGRLVEATELLVDESVLTGESEPVGRGAGDPVRSGSFAVDGSGAFVVEAVGADSYAGRLSGEARTFRHPRSPLELALNRLLIVLVAVMVPLALALGTALALRSRPLHEAVATAVAGVVSLVPEGLLLLSGLTMAVAALRMARRGVLAQQLNAVESLASVDVVCTDKTGTLTERTLRLLDVVPAPGCDEAELREALGGYAGSWPARDETLDALASALPAAPPAPGAVVPFSSDRRWGAIEAGGRALVLGAPEAFSLGSLSEQARDATARGRRVLALGRASALPETRSDRLGDGVAVLGLAVLAERLRPNAAATIAFLR